MKGVGKTKFGEVEWYCAHNSDGGLTFKVVVFSEDYLAQLDGRTCELWRRDMKRRPWKCFPIRRDAVDRLAGSVNISKRETATLPANMVLGITVPLHAVCLVIDCSATANDEFLAVLKRSLCQLFTESDFMSQGFLATVKLGIVQFGLDDEESVVCAPGPDIDAFYQGLARLRAAGAPGHLEEVIDKAAEILGDVQTGVERLLIVLTPAGGRVQNLLATAAAKLPGITVHANGGSRTELAEAFAALTHATPP
jgi:hypothetical protein